MAVPDRHREVGLERPRADLLEHLLAKVSQVSGLLLGPGVLGFEVRDGVRIVCVAEPLVLVDDLVAVVAADDGTTGCDGRLVHDSTVSGAASSGSP